MADAPCLGVARFQKPHGLKGEAVILPLTDEPGRVLAAGRSLVPVDLEGHPVGAALVIEGSRPYHRRWLLKFQGLDDRAALDALRDQTLGAPIAELTPPGPDEFYEHELDGVAVEVGGAVIGRGRGLVRVPGGQLLAVALTDGREVLVPFRAPFVVAVSRERQAVVLDPPDGMLELE